MFLNKIFSNLILLLDTILLHESIRLILFVYIFVPLFYRQLTGIQKIFTRLLVVAVLTFFFYIRNTLRYFEETKNSVYRISENYTLLEKVFIAFTSYTPMSGQALNSATLFKNLFENYNYSGDFDKIVERKYIKNQYTMKTIAVFTESTGTILPTCKYYSCSFRKSLNIEHQLKIADAIVFEGTNLPLIPPQRSRQNQTFVIKSNILGKLSEPYKNRYFDWIMSSQRDSDVPLPQTIIVPKEYASAFEKESQMTGIYGDIRHHDFYIQQWYIKHFTSTGQPKTGSGQPVALGSPYKNYSSVFTAKHPNVSSVYISSSCIPSKLKSSYFITLTNIVQMDIVTPCDQLKCSRRNIACIAKTYKFYFVSDTSCDIRISDFLLKLYGEDIVLVTHGSEKYSKLFPKETYIDSRDFESVSHLASYLNELSGDETKYLEIIRRKDMFVKVPFRNIKNIAYCRLCYMLNRPSLYQKERINIDEWIKTKHCQTYHNSTDNLDVMNTTEY